MTTLQKVVALTVVAVLAGASYLANRLYGATGAESGRIADEIASGKIKDRRDAPAKGPAEPPVDRPTGRADEILTVSEVDAAATRPTDRRKLAVLRGNGEFARLPVSPDEPGPLVASQYDRAEADALLRKALALSKSAKGPYRVDVRLRASVETRLADALDAAPFLKAAGRSVQRAAAPERLRLRTVAGPTATPADAPAWPLKRQTPESFMGGALVDAERARLKELCVELKVGAAFRHASGPFVVAVVDPLP